MLKLLTSAMTTVVYTRHVVTSAWTVRFGLIRSEDWSPVIRGGHLHYLIHCQWNSLDINTWSRLLKMVVGGAAKTSNGYNGRPQQNILTCVNTYKTVSYTHLDVYKRQVHIHYVIVILVKPDFIHIWNSCSPTLAYKRLSLGLSYACLSLNLSLIHI